MANREKLKIAFLNIIINAVEAMEPGKGILTVSVEPSKNMHVVVIRDNGCACECAAVQLLTSVE